MVIDITPFVPAMKEWMKVHPFLKKYLKDMMDDGLTEDESLDIMIEVWLRRVNK